MINDLLKINVIKYISQKKVDFFSQNDIIIEINYGNYKIKSDIITDQYLEPQIGVDINVYTSARTKVYYMGDSDVMSGSTSSRTVANPIHNTSSVVVSASGTITNALP